MMVEEADGAIDEGATGSGLLVRIPIQADGSAALGSIAMSSGKQARRRFHGSQTGLPPRSVG